MAESLLSFSNIDLFGVHLDDLQLGDKEITWRVRLVSNVDVKPEHNTEVAGAPTAKGDFVLLLGQDDAISSSEEKGKNGIYRVTGDGDWAYIPLNDGDLIRSGGSSRDESLNYGVWVYNKGRFKKIERFKNRGSRHRKGANRQLESQLGLSAHFARIYGFSYEGRYYDVERPCIFIVHGKGELVNLEETDPPGDPQDSRAPRPTYLTGLAAAGFDFADGLRVWSYDKADYSIRMDVETGMFEDILLDAVIGNDGDGLDARGMNARGMNVRGMNARGMNVRGMNARGGGHD
jgi:hypothetical protein